MTDAYMYGALMLHKAGKKVDEASLTSLVKAAGVEVDQVKVKALASALSEVNIDEALKNAAAMAMAAPAAAARAGWSGKGSGKAKGRREERGRGASRAGLALRLEKRQTFRWFQGP